MQIYITTTRIMFSFLSSIAAKDPTRDCYVPGDSLHVAEIYSPVITLSRTSPSCIIHKHTEPTQSS
jgi:hypothetical protein